MTFKALCLAASTLAAAPALAQITPGESVQLTIGPNAVGIDVVDVQGNGSTTPVTGALPSSRELDNGVIDPITGDIWVLGRVSDPQAPDKGLVYRFSLSGSVVTTEVSVLDSVSIGTDLGGIAFDKNGDLFVGSHDGIWKIDRHSFAVQQWTGTAPAGTRNSLTIDRETNTMWAVSFNGITTPGSEIREFDLDAGPSAGVAIFDAIAGAMPLNAAAITHDDNGKLYVGCWDGIYGFNTQTAVASLVPTSALMNPKLGVTNEFNSLDYDSINNNLHTSGGILGSAAYYTIDPITGANALINTDHFCESFSDPSDPFCTEADVMSGLSVSDYLHTTQVFPREASQSTTFQLEVAAQGNPGDFAAMAVVELNGIALASPLVLGSYGLCGLGGNYAYSTSVPAGVLPSFVTSIGFNTLTYDFTSGIATNGGVETVQILP